MQISIFQKLKPFCQSVPVRGGHGGEFVERKELPISFGGGFAEVEPNFVAGDRVGKAEYGLGVGGVGGREEPEAFPARARGGDQVNPVAADRQRAPLDEGGSFFFAGFDGK